ncbi:D-ribose pyranase [Thermotoga sp. KOL6]|uniref:D-ribose pyranase n=1 Tax=Thermotoga sp. KOL6 TaxID=126741 RepID=UPI000C7592BE|nr:D-ribose pyranase [Thermotoga sp. KOL6]PLV58292.1 ribose pyranase [Thermotoga sp. KOL6]
MKKTGILNSEISKIVAEMGHMDLLTIADLGFPIPQGVKKVDLVIDNGRPGLLEVVEVILKELKVEKIILAEEMKTVNSSTLQKLVELIEEINGPVKVEFVPHEEFKKISRDSKGIIRTGANVPYSNVILVGGVTF